MKWFLPIILVLGLSGSAVSQDLDSEASAPRLDSDPKIAFLKSLVVPGWGHHHVNPSDWERGQYHLAAEAALLLSYAGLKIHSGNMRQNWFTYARAEAGVDIEPRDRGFRLAVEDYDNLDAYNDYQERSRNWDQLYEDISANRWNWSDTGARHHYRDLRSRFETMEQQLPALLSLMVLNRVISAVSAYNRAQHSKSAGTTFSLDPVQGTHGVVARMSFRF
ncbi:hypothetical protein [Halalkalibaculum sp. DA384]|uniref:hypothetical protein n=1 Tax=Halalkalibaculum sp. DA384 TaxID=3373606 RepID=UPI003754F481